MNRSSKVECQVWKGQWFKELQTNDTVIWILNAGDDSNGNIYAIQSDW